MEKIRWKGIDWQPCMANGRIINPNKPWQWYGIEAVWKDFDDNLCLGITTHPKQVYSGGTTYESIYCVGVARSVETFGYGTYSAEIKLPKGSNLWPSFWLVGEGKWPDNGEIDICEAWSNKNGSYYRFPLGWRTTNNIHYAINGIHNQVGSKNVPILKQPKNPTENFINYTVEWRPDKVTFFVNGKKVREVGRDVCTYFVGDRMHVIFNLWTDTLDFTFNSPLVIKTFNFKPL